MDEENFHAFYEQTSRGLRAYLRSMLTDQATVDDLFQEAWFRFLNARLPADMEPDHRKNYLYRIATNLANDHYRKRGTEPLPEHLTTPASGYSPDVERAFRSLKPREREALWLAYVECFSHSEIAAVLRLTTASVRPTLARARTRFTEVLRKRGIVK